MPLSFIIQKKAFAIKCHRCQYRWAYTGHNKYIASCPHCGTKVSIRSQVSALEKNAQENGSVND